MPTLRQVDGFSPSSSTTSFAPDDSDLIKREAERYRKAANSSSNKNQNGSDIEGKNKFNFAFFRLALVNFIATFRHRMYKMMVFAFIIYPLYLFRRWGERYTQKQTNRRQKQRCEAILQSTEEYSTWKSVAMILDSFGGYEEWRKYSDDDNDEDETLEQRNEKTDFIKSHSFDSSTTASSSSISGTHHQNEDESLDKTLQGKSSSSIIASSLYSLLPSVITNRKKGNKNNNPKKEYNEKKIHEAAEFIDRILETHSEVAMGTYIRTSLVREMFGLGCPELHKFYAGSKESVEHYLTSVETLIDRFVNGGGNNNKQNAMMNSKKKVENSSSANNAKKAVVDGEGEDNNNNTNNGSLTSRSNRSPSRTGEERSPLRSARSLADIVDEEARYYSSQQQSNNNNKPSKSPPPTQNHDKENTSSSENDSSPETVAPVNDPTNNNDDDQEDTTTTSNDDTNNDDDDMSSPHLVNTAFDIDDKNKKRLQVGPHLLELLQWAKQDDAAAESKAAWSSRHHQKHDHQQQPTTDSANDSNNTAPPSPDRMKSTSTSTSTKQKQQNEIGEESNNAHHNTKNNSNKESVYSMSTKEKFLLLKDAAQAFGRTALMLSGGASLGMYHAGVIRSLYNANILPKIISGSSAGAIIAAIFCVRTDEECGELLADSDAGGLEEKVSLNAFDSYDDPVTSISTRVWRLIKTGAFMDVQVLMDCMRANCGDSTFADAYKRTGRILNIATASVSREGGKNAKSMVLNYVTAPNVLIWTAVAASCAYPRLFTAVQLLQKHPITGAIHPYLPGQKWNDGSITADLPAERLAELFNANFFIVSQVNPHVAPFIRPSLGHLVHKKSSKVTQFFQNMWFSACEELRYWILKCFRHGMISLEGENELLFLQLSQTYSGDVTIRPIRSFFSALPDYINLTSNPTKELLQYVTGTAQRRTWPHVTRIEANMRIELALQKAMTDLREKKKEEF